jgi:LAO/AO transport system kinase
MEMADTLAITKADGSNIQKAELAATQYRTALHLFPKSQSGWSPNVLTCSSVTGVGIENVWKSVMDYMQLTRSNEFFHYRRLEQAKYWMYETINQSLKSHFYSNPEIEHDLPVYEQMVLEDKMSSFAAARHLLKKYIKHGKLD